MSPDTTSFPELEGFESDSAVASRIGCTPTHFARLKARGEITAKRSLLSKTFYQTEQLNALRARHVARIMDSTVVLTDEEKRQLAGDQDLRRAVIAEIQARFAQMLEELKALVAARKP